MSTYTIRVCGSLSIKCAELVCAHFVQIKCPDPFSFFSEKSRSHNATAQPQFINRLGELFGGKSASLGGSLRTQLCFRDEVWMVEPLGVTCGAGFTIDPDDACMVPLACGSLDGCTAPQIQTSGLGPDSNVVFLQPCEVDSFDTCDGS